MCEHEVWARSLILVACLQLVGQRVRLNGGARRGEDHNTCTPPVHTSCSTSSSPLLLTPSLHPILFTPAARWPSRASHRPSRRRRRRPTGPSAGASVRAGSSRPRQACQIRKGGGERRREETKRRREEMRGEKRGRSSSHVTRDALRSQHSARSARTQPPGVRRSGTAAAALPTGREEFTLSEHSMA